MPLASVLHFIGLRDRELELRAITRRRDELSELTDNQLKTAAQAIRGNAEVVEVFALAAAIAERVLGLRMFDVQIRGALTLQRGHIAEMQTGEGKTLAAVPAVAWYALKGRGTHVLTANDYLARRDASWMGKIYEWFGLSVAHISQNMPTEWRRIAYSCDVTYATANEVGFDYLRDGLARSVQEMVQRPFAFAVIDEVDSILIDEARIPLVIAGGVPDDGSLAYRVDSVVLRLRPHTHYFLDEFARNVQLTDSGIRQVEGALACGGLFDERNIRILTAVQDALHAHALLKRNVDYVVKNGSVELVDEFKGRIAHNRRWPAGLQSAIEAKERVVLKAQGRILGSITVQTLVGMYERICGMTGTAVTQTEEFWKIYKLPVTVIPTNRPVVRQDLPDILYAHKSARNRALVDEIRKLHETGRPILVGTASVEESELLSRRLQMAGIPHSVLNARNDEAEAEIIAQAGALGAVTISTNMAGRGTDILLGGNPPKDREKVVELGGLYVIGTTRHEARRIDNQLRGRAGRQGDPGASRFFISLEDDLLVRFGVAENPDIDSVQRTAESQNLEIRQMLWKYESLVEHHRREVYNLRREILLSPAWSIKSMLPEEQYEELVQAVGEHVVATAGRRLALAVIDDLWADYLANVAELKGGIHWVSWGGRDPLYEFLTGVEEIYADLQQCLREEIAEGFAMADIRDGEIRFQNEERFERGATWTYLTTDQPFGTLGERIMKGLRARWRRRSVFIVYLVLALLPFCRSARAEDPLRERVLVVYNKGDSDSQKVAKYYLAKRGIPATNTCKIDPFSTDFIDLPDFESGVKKPVRKCLEAIGRQKILYIVFSYQTPFGVNIGGRVYSLDQFIADIWDDYLPMRPATPADVQPYFGRAESEGNLYEPFVPLASYRDKPGTRQIYSVWRLDAATPVLAKGLVDKAMAAEANGLKGVACLDRRNADMSTVADHGYGAGDWDIFRAAGFARQAGFSVTEDKTDQEFGTPPAPLRCDGAALYAGWYSLNHYNDAFTWTPGAIGIHLDSASAINPRNGPNWVANAVVKGITVTSGAVGEPYLENLPHPDQVFLYLFQGANVGDAFLRGTRMLKWMILNIGDPLYRPFPGGVKRTSKPNPELILALLPQWTVAGSTSSAAIVFTEHSPEAIEFAVKSSRPELVTIPSSVLLPANTDHVRFPISTHPITGPEITVRISVSGHGLESSNTLVLFPKATGGEK